MEVGSLSKRIPKLCGLSDQQASINTVSLRLLRNLPTLRQVKWKLLSERLLGGASIT